jgi:hypothetical protein
MEVELYTDSKETSRPADRKDSRWVGVRMQIKILTRADLPTPPDPSTTNLYSRMAGSLHRTAPAVCTGKTGRGVERKIFNTQSKTKSNKGGIPLCFFAKMFPPLEKRKDSSHSWSCTHNNGGGTPISGSAAAAGWRR